MDFVFESAGERLIARRLDRFAGRAVHAKPAFEEIASDLRKLERKLFDTQGASGGQPWKPDAASTVAQKQRGGLDPRVLHATGRLRRSLTDKHDPQHEELATDSFLLFGSKVGYAGYHQKGEGVPRRRPLQFTEAQKRSALKRLQRFIVTGSA